ncbi:MULTISPECIES: SUKH-4 family immunity protein [Streptomyces]|uniref:SUKH-4 family immunity protein n=1 Tax=Streptomyces siderophoricus TaxID=2802281 RepID=A0ABS1N550_9ACTN|nr:SUKH-4 family immunity protein [Streptomyces sp. 9-7]MBL1095021.1 SUKH-4 family immunity protein [Streptomyces sp. 9-7]
MSRDVVLARLTDWLQEPGRHPLTVPVTGPVGSGKTPCVKDAEEAARRFGRCATTQVDCRGLTADDVATRLIDAWGGDERFRRTQHSPLTDAFTRWTKDAEKAVVLLANVQWAGPTVTSTEPRRLIDDVVVPLLRSGRCPVAVVVEVDQEQERAPLPANLDLADVPPLGLPAPSGPPLPELLARIPQLRALAAAEVRDVPLAVWSLLSTALGLDGEPEVLRTVVDTVPHLLTTTADDGTGTEHLAFRADGVRHLVRRQLPLERAEHARITDALTAAAPLEAAAPPPCRAGGPVAAYGFRALPLHCAAAGVLADRAREARFLARVDRHALLTGLALTYPAGIPGDVPALDVHYLEAAGVEPAGHEEWICWLHWAAMNRGATAFAEELARTAGELPWLTRWSRWRPYGLFGPSPVHDEAEADELVGGVAQGIPVVASQLEIDEDDWDTRGGATEPDPDADWYASERLWRLDDGTPMGGAVQVALYYDDDGGVDRAADRSFEPAEEPEDADRFPSPRTPESSTCLVKAAHGVQVHGGSPGGLYALRITDPARVTSKPRWRSRPLLTPHNTSAVWPLPDALRTAGGPPRSWYERAFGPGSCRVASEDELPDGLVHSDTVRFLTEVGLPELDAEFPYLSFDAPRSITQAARPAALPSSAGPGPFYRLGTWLKGELLADGTSGAVHLTEVGDGDADHRLATGLRQVCTLLALTVQRRDSGFTLRAEELDAQHSLATWAKDIDPVAAAHPHWTALLSGHWDDPEVV